MKTTIVGPYGTYMVWQRVDGEWRITGPGGGVESINEAERSYEVNRDVARIMAGTVDVSEETSRLFKGLFGG